MTQAYSVGALFATLGLDTTAFAAGLGAADAAMKKTGARMAATGAKMSAVGKKMTTNLTLPIVAFGVAAVSSQMKFEAALAKIEGLVGVSTDQVKKWQQAILDIGPAVGKGPAELADALFFITSAGIKGAEAMKVLEMAAKASAVGLGDTETVADLVTSAMNAYGKETLSAAMATDILVATVREGKAPADALASSMGKVLPIAAEMGVQFNEVGAAIAAMTRTGTSADIAATQLKSILSGLLKPTKESADMMIEWGIGADKMRKMIGEQGLIATLEHLRKTTNKYGEDAIATVFPNIRALMGVLDLMGKNAEDNIGIFNRMKDSTGSLDRAMVAIADTTKFKWDKATAQIKKTFTQLGIVLKSTIVPMIEKFTQKVAAITERFMELNDTQKKTIISLAGLAAAAGPVLLVFGKLFKLIGLNPYVAMAAGVLLLVAAIVKGVRANRELRDGYTAVADATEKASKQFNTQRNAVELLQRQVEDTNLSNKTRLLAIEKLKTIMPKYNATLTDEGVLIGDNKTLIDDYLVSLKEKIKLQVFEAEQVALLKKQLNAERDLEKAIDKKREAKLAFEAAGSP